MERDRQRADHRHLDRMPADADPAESEQRQFDVTDRGDDRRNDRPDTTMTTWRARRGSSHAIATATDSSIHTAPSSFSHGMTSTHATASSS